VPNFVFVVEAPGKLSGGKSVSLEGLYAPSQPHLAKPDMLPTGYGVILKRMKAASCQKRGSDFCGLSRLAGRTLQAGWIQTLELQNVQIGDSEYS